MLGADKRDRAVWRRPDRWLVRAAARRRATKRAEVVERRGYRRISAERPQRPQPCRRPDGGSRSQFDLEDERRRRARDGGLSEGPCRPARRSPRFLRRRRRRWTMAPRVYKGACIACHEADGAGAPRIYPPLPGNANLQSADPSSTLRIILDGAETMTTARAPNTGSMPAYASKAFRSGNRRCRHLCPQFLGQSAPR